MRIVDKSKQMQFIIFPSLFKKNIIHNSKSISCEKKQVGITLTVHQYNDYISHNED